MSDKFNGFSQDEINKVSGNRTIKKQSAEAIKQGQGLKRIPEKAFKHSEVMRKQTPPVVAKTTIKTNNDPKMPNNNNNYLPPTPPPADPDDTLNLNGSMSKSLEDALFFAPLKMQSNGKTRNATAAETIQQAAALTDSSDDSSILKLSDLTNQNSKDGSSILPILPNSTEDDSQLNTDSPFKGVSLKDFEVQRKMIEEQNKQKKELLYKAIEQHTQRTVAETRKIEEIRHELSKLETDLAVDVALLRKQIDAACIHFANVEKQYIKIESQFLKSKIELHNAAEKKELLTEHLCTVIAHNEDRKAQKLTELMQKVGLTPSDDYIAPALTPVDEH